MCHTLPGVNNGSIQVEGNLIGAGLDGEQATTRDKSARPVDEIELNSWLDANPLDGCVKRFRRTSR